MAWHLAYLLVYCFCVYLLLRYCFAWRWRWLCFRGVRLPPGPSGLPLVGNLIFGRAPVSMVDLEKRYGPIFTLWLGSMPSIIVSGADATREALLDRGPALASRPRFPSRAILTANHSIMNSSSYGTDWRTLRRGLMTEVLGPSRLKMISSIRKSLIDSLISWLKEEAARNEGVVPVSSSCRLTIFKILAYMCVGRHLDDDTLHELDEVAKHTLILQGFLKGDFVPILGLLERKQVKIRQEYRKRQEKLWGPLVEENRELRNKGQPRVGCYIDTLLAMEFENKELKLQSNQIAALCTEFMNAGTDTTAVCVEWAMANLMLHPHIQDKVYQQISDVVGGRTLGENDISSLPYLRAIIKETLRRHPSAHFTFPHVPTNGPIKVAGYDIPADAIVNFQLSSVLRDPTVWEEPMEFRPERFLDKEIDVTGWKKTTAIPFGAGRRICPGANLALLHANLMVGRLVQCLHWSPPQHGEKVDMSERKGGVVGMKNPLFASVKERASP